MNNISWDQRDNFKNKNEFQFSKKTSNLSHKPEPNCQSLRKNLNKDKKSFQNMENSTSKQKSKEYRKGLKTGKSGQLQRAGYRIT